MASFAQIKEISDESSQQCMIEADFRPLAKDFRKTVTNCSAARFGAFSDEWRVQQPKRRRGEAS